MPPPTRVSCDGIRWVVLGSLRGFCGMRWRHVMSDHRCSSALPGQLAASLLPNAAEPRWMPRSACVAPQLAAPAPAGALGRVAPLAARPRAPAAILLPINSNAPLLCIPLPSLRSPAEPYDKDSTGFNACGFGRLEDYFERMFAAMNYLQFDGTCGRCIKVQGTDSGASGKWYTVKIIDNCPTCNRGDVDFSSEVGGWMGG